MIRYCFSCKTAQVFDSSFDEDCLRCSECGSLPYSEKDGKVVCERCKKNLADENYSSDEYGNFCEACGDYLDAQADIYAKDLVVEE